MTEESKIILEKLRGYCATEDRCHQQIQHKLDQYDMITQEEKDEIIISLIQDDFLNEMRFAKSFVRGKFRIKKWGKFKIKRHLMQMNISTRIIQSALTEISDDDYREVFEEWLYKKKKQKTDKRKIYNFLLSKGFENFYILQNWDL